MTQRDSSPCHVCGAVYPAVRGRLAETEEWTGTFVAVLHSHAVARTLRTADRSPVTRTAHLLVSLEVYPDAGVSLMAMAARIDATENAQEVAWEAWEDSPLSGTVALDARLEPAAVFGSVDAGIFARVAGAVSDLPEVAAYLGFGGSGFRMAQDRRDSERSGT